MAKKDLIECLGLGQEGRDGEEMDKWEDWDIMLKKANFGDAWLMLTGPYSSTSHAVTPMMLSAITVCLLGRIPAVQRFMCDDEASIIQLKARSIPSFTEYIRSA